MDSEIRKIELEDLGGVLKPGEKFIVQTITVVGTTLVLPGPIRIKPGDRVKLELVDESAPGPVA